MLYRTTFACIKELKGLIAVLRQREAACQVARDSCMEEATLPSAAVWALLALEEGKARAAEQVEDTIPTTVEVGLQFVTIINMLERKIPIRENFSNSQISLTRVNMKNVLNY